MSPNDSYSQHVVTAVIVAHDGAAWLTRGLKALNEQTRSAQRVVAVDTGSRDRSGTLLTAEFGQGAVFGMDRSTGYASAVRRAVQHKAANAAIGGKQGRARTEQVEWLWLLHDDCEPAADALEQLLRGAAETPNAAVLGPKLMDWTDRDVIVEAGIAIDTIGRRITGIEPGEVDQGQHDGDRDTLAVSSAGMLVRRDVWEQVGGFDPGMALFGEDIDFCWRVHAAGYRVRVVTDAVVFHAQAAARGRRAISVGRRSRLLERRNALLTLLGNLPLRAMITSAVSNLTLSVMRTLFYLVAKRPTAALDESAAVVGVMGHPLRLANARSRRARGRRSAYSRLRSDLLPGRSMRRVLEFGALLVSRSSPQDDSATRHASDDPTEDDSLLIDTGLIQRLLTRPGVLLVLALIAITIAAERSLVTAGTLGGGALLPAWEGSASLWSQFVQGFHPVGVGSTSAGLPYVGLLAVLSTILGGKPWLAIDFLLLGCVPLAGVTAILALRRVTKSVPVRVWAAASYALLPVAFGAIAAGRLGSAVAFALIPLIGLLAARMFVMPAKLARRAAWATGLTIAVGAAFVPLLWAIAVVGAVAAGVTLWRSRPALLLNLTIVIVTPVVLLMPWMMQLLSHPSRLLLEAGVQQQGLADIRLPAKSLLLLSPGGPGLPPYWVSSALLLMALLAMLATRRRRLIVVGWSVAVLGFATALAVSHATVTVANGQVVTPWPGVALAVTAAGLLLAAAAGADGLGRFLTPGGRKRVRRVSGLRGAAVAALALVACTAPVAAAGYWLANGISGPLGAASGQIVPKLVTATAGGGHPRTLVLTTSGSHMSYLLLRGASPQFGDPGLTQDPAARATLNKAVAALVAPGGGDAVNQTEALARFNIGYVLMPAPASNALAAVLNGVAGLTQVTMTSSYDLWRLSTPPAGIRVVETSGKVDPIASGATGVAGAKVPTAGGILEIPEPTGGWTASVDGHGLTPVPSPAGRWSQAFTLPGGGGTLTISHNAPIRTALTLFEILAFILVAGLALPGVRTAAEIEAAAAGLTVDESADAPAGRPTGGRGEDQGDDRPRHEAAAVGAGASASSGGAASSGQAGRSGQAGPTLTSATAASRGRAAALSTDDATVVARRASRSSGSSDRPGTRQSGDRAGQSGEGADGGNRLQRGRAAAKRAARFGRGKSQDDDRGSEETRVTGSRSGLPLPARSSSNADRGSADSRSANGGATRDRRRGTPPRRSEAPGEPVSGRAAWPAGQPASRFLDGPPSRSSADDEYSGRGRRALPPSGPPAGARSPSGTPYDEPSGYGDTRGYGDSRGSGDTRGYGDSRGSGDTRGYGDSRGSGDSRRHSRRSGYGDEAAIRTPSGSGPDSSADERRERDSSERRSHRRHSRGRSRDDAGRGREPRDDASSPPSSGRASRSQHSWSQDQQDGWPQYGQQGQSQWQVPGQQQWPDQGGALEALPPDEVHHDWAAGDDRGSRNWPAPGSDGEGESW